MGESTDKCFEICFRVITMTPPYILLTGRPMTSSFSIARDLYSVRVSSLRIDFVQIKLWMCCGVFISLSNALNVAINWTGSRGRLSITVTDWLQLAGTVVQYQLTCQRAARNSCSVLFSTSDQMFHHCYQVSARIACLHSRPCNVIPHFLSITE